MKLSSQRVALRLRGNFWRDICWLSDEAASIDARAGTFVSFAAEEASGEQLWSRLQVIHEDPAKARSRVAGVMDTER